MIFKKRVSEYMKNNFSEVLHTTLNPAGPGVVRIHLVPPRNDDGDAGVSVAIINGQDIIPVNTSWSILLAEFIKAVNAYSGRPVHDEDVADIIKNTLKGVRKVYPLLSGKLIKNDIYKIMNTFQQIARGERTDEAIGCLNLGDYSVFMRAPHRMDLMVSAMTREGSWHCNQRCIHCYAAGQPLSEERELSTEEWKAVIDKCREVGIPQLTFTGGEPTMREDLVELIEHAAWFVTRLNTNGLALTSEFCRRLHAASLDSMQITFYSAVEKIHNTLVGAEHYADTVAGIENAIEAGINISVNTPLCTLNRDYRGTLEFLHSKGVIYVTCSGLITTGRAACESSERLQLSESEISEILREAVEYCHANGMEISFTSPGWVDGVLCSELGISTPTCGACLSNMAITPGGNVVPCQSWLSDDALGNMLSDNWDDIWESEACRKRREYSAFMLGECPLRLYADCEEGKSDE